MTTPKKRRVLSLAEKKTIIEAAETESNKTKLAEQFGLAIGTLCGILKEKEAILGTIDAGSQAKRAHLKSGKHDRMEEALIIWHKQVRSQNVPVSGDLMKKKALAIAAQLGIINFKASTGWLDNFKHRHGIQLKTRWGIFSKEVGAGAGAGAKIFNGGARRWRWGLFSERVGAGAGAGADPGAGTTLINMRQRQSK